MDLEKLWVKIEHLFIARMPFILLALFILIIGWWIIKFIHHYISGRISDPHVDPSIRPFFLSLITIVLRLILVLTALQMAGFKLTIFTVLLGSLGVAAGLALSGTLQNFASGALILLLKPFHVGDKIIAQGKEGIISSIQMFYTVMIGEDNRMTIIPNSKLSNEIIVNTTGCNLRKLEIKLKFKYTTDWPTLKTSINSVIDHLPKKQAATLVSADNIEKHAFERKIGVLTLEPDGYTIVIHVWVPSSNFNYFEYCLSENLLRQLKDQTTLPGT
ncbi:hypothetical protein GCM10027566_27620 [Arachidicoccus ginsenosidivorans]|uniref:Mechanosensitive ion channel family protein n=1 Tax=Arachidicoccus ginsenosidivorans TaxID=496057 RepID=A0A5B8VSE2_9BACT|nr:mechanosensitive ion channel family protein [Arachidicoccus ginsenosidivorans]QEC73636.1 mechanosensitive ion channel family protein [Arachidicoccus ginsenosidivorans]